MPSLAERLEMHRLMCLLREFDAKLEQAVYFHSAAGEDAVPVGTFFGIGADDWAAPQYRGAEIVFHMRGASLELCEHSMLLESSDEEAVGGAEDLVPIGSARVAREGDDVTIAAHGYMVRRALEAAEDLAESGISAEVLDLRTLAPFPEHDLVTAVRRTGALCFVGEDWPRCSVASEALAVASERCHSDLRVAPRRICSPAVPISTNRSLHPHLIPTPERIATEVAETLGTVAAA